MTAMLKLYDKLTSSPALQVALASLLVAMLGAHPALKRAKAAQSEALDRALKASTKHQKQEAPDKIEKHDNNDTKRTTPFVNLEQYWWYWVYVFSFPVALVAIAASTEADDGGILPLGTLAICVGLTELLKLFPKPMTHPISFGIRGSGIAFFAVASLYSQLHGTIPNNKEEGLQGRPTFSPYHFWSLVAFGNAAWMACGLGSFGAWAAYPEYGEFRHRKRFFLCLVQSYILLGFFLESLCHCPVFQK